MREGEPGQECYVIAEGTAGVSIEGRPVASLGVGEMFGEMSLLDMGPRVATVTAESPVRLCVLNPREFGTLLEVPSVGRKIVRELAARLRACEAAPNA